MIRRFFAVLLLLLAAPLAHAESLRVLFIGNSYTYYHQMPLMLSQLAAASGKELRTRAVTHGGATLKGHWYDGVAQTVLQQEKWDIVVLQDGSVAPISDPRSTQRYAKLFDEKIKAAGAQTVFYATWARATAPESQKTIDHVYQSLARELGARVAPVGDAWAIAHAAAPSMRLHEFDDSHPTFAGSCLAAYVFHTVLFGSPPAHPPAGLASAEHAVLAEAAAQAVRASNAQEVDR